jgi:hypothetical protein
MGKTQFLEQSLHSAVEAVVVEIFLQEQTLLVKMELLAAAEALQVQMGEVLELQDKEIMELQEILDLRFKAAAAAVQELLERLLEEEMVFSLLYLELLLFTEVEEEVVLMMLEDLVV